jgi:hypothetical protein
MNSVALALALTYGADAGMTAESALGSGDADESSCDADGSCTRAGDGDIVRILLYDNTFVDEMFDAPFTNHCRDTCKFFVKSLEHHEHLARQEDPERFVLDTGHTLTVTVREPGLGVSFTPGNATQVQDVVPGGQMERLGVRSGDRIAALNGLRIQPGTADNAFMGILRRAVAALPEEFKLLVQRAIPQQVEPPDAIVFPVPSWNYSSWPSEKPAGQVWDCASHKSHNTHTRLSHGLVMHTHCF